MNYKTFKNEVSNLKEYKAKVKILQTKIDDTIYIYAGVKGVGYDAIHVSHNQIAADMKLVELSEKITPYQKKLDWLLQAIDLIENNISLLPKDTQEMVKLLFVNGCSFQKVGDVYGYSANGVYQKVKREVERL